MIHWIYLILAGLFEVGVTYCLAKLKDVAGLELAGWSVALLCGMAISIFFVNKSMESIPLGIAYPVWTGIGAAGAVIVGCLFFGETLTFRRILFISMLIIAIIGLEKS
ncbi:MAG: multidrug efflux SMR transporter [Muribaculum sp.]|nr:multidrug efflux SMR transporter [Muribaculum sp.]